MLSGMRTATKNWLGRVVMGVLFGLLSISFAIWGIGDIFRGYGANTVAVVGPTEIGVETLRRAYVDEIQRLSQQARRGITNEQARSLGIDRQVLQRLVSDAVLDDSARKLGLVVSDKTVAQSLLNEQAFKGPDGQFNRDTFNQYLRQTGYNEAGFLRQQALVMARQQISEGIGVEPYVPEIWFDIIDRFRNEKRDISYFVLPATSLGEIAAPDEAALKAFFEQRKAQYRAPEYRQITLLSVLPRQFQDDVSVTDEELHKAYDEAAKAGRFGAPEKRTIQQIVFPNENDAAAASVKLASGTPFETLVTERNLKDSDVTLGTKTKADIFDPAIANAAFSLPEGGSSAPVKGQFGTVIVHVSKIEPAQVKPFDAVKDTLHAEVAQRKLSGDQKVRDQINNLRDQIEDQRASGKALAEIAKDLKLKARAIAGIDTAGNDKNGDKIADIPDEAEVLKAVFGSDVGLDNEAVRTRDNGYVWFEINAIDPGRDRTFDEVKDKVTAAWQEDEAAKRLSAKADDVLKALRGGEKLEDQAVWLHSTVEKAEGLTRAQPGPLGVNVLTAVFAGRKDAFGEALAPNGHDRVIFQLTGINLPPRQPDVPADEQLRKQLASASAEDVMTQYILYRQNELGLTVNEQAFRQATGGSEN
jgi:peptidyl-prolyl cis-trans isomerase D